MFVKISHSANCITLVVGGMGYVFILWTISEVRNSSKLQCSECSSFAVSEALYCLKGSYNGDMV